MNHGWFIFCAQHNGMKQSNNYIIHGATGVKFALTTGKACLIDGQVITREQALETLRECREFGMYVRRMGRVINHAKLRCLTA